MKSANNEDKEHCPIDYRRSKKLFGVTGAAIEGSDSTVRSLHVDQQ